MKRRTKLLASLCLSAMAMAFLFGTQRKSNSVPEPIKIAGTENSKAPQGKTAYTPLDEYYSSNQYISMNHLGNIENVWDYYKGEGMRVAVIDTAFDWDHPDFIDENNESIFDCENGQFIMHCTQDTSQEATYNYNYYGGIVIFNVPKTGYYQIDGQKLYGNDLLKPTSDQQNTNFNYHGTNVASTIASVNHQTSHTGTVGIAPKVKIVPFKTDLRFDCVAYALEHVGDLNEDSDSSNDIQVVNMSIEGTSTWNAMQTQITRLINQGVIIIAAAGNHSTSTTYYPASCPGVIGVGALAKNSSTTLASYSNYNAPGHTSSSNNNVDLVAPGSVYAASWTTSGHTYIETQGTSFASPIVAGAAALWKQVHPSGTVDEFKSDLWNSCVDIGTSGWDTTFGYGRLDIGKLINYVPVTGIEVTPSSVTLNLDNHETATLTATISPSNATNKDFIWETSNSNIATVNNSGVVTPVKAGSCQIYAITEDGDFDDYCDVTVTGSTQSYFTLGWGNASGTAGTYKNFTSVSGSQDGLLSFTTAKNSGTNDPAYNSTSSQLRLYYNSNGNGNSITITPTASTTITGFELVCDKDGSAPTIGYKIGSGAQTSLNASNVTYTASGFTSVTSSPLTIQNIHKSNVQLRIRTLKVTYTQIPTVNAISVEHSPNLTTYQVGDFFDPTGLIIRRTYTDSSYDTLSYAGHSSQFTFTPDLNTALTMSYSSVMIGVGGFTTTQSITVNKAPVVSITAVANKTFYVGETITKSNITVTDNNGDIVTHYDFDSYKFVYDDATSGGALTNKELNVQSGVMSATLVAQVQRKGYESTVGASDTLTRATTGVISGSNSYSNWNGKSVSSTAVYAGNSAGGNNSIQLRSSGNSGIITTTSGGNIKKITVNWNTNTVSGRTLNVYGKNSAYSATSDLYSTNTRGTLLGTIVKGTSTELTINDSYSFVGVRSSDSAMYLNSITFSYGGDENPTNVANYIMFEDTEGQCADVGQTKGKFSNACDYFGELTKEGRSTFMESNDYVISTARERFIAWAAYHHKTIQQSGDDYIITPSIQSQILMNITSNSPSIIVIMASIICLSALGGYIFIRKRKEQ